MENSNLQAVESVRKHVTEKMLYAVLQDIKVASGFFDKTTLSSRIQEYIDDCYKPSNIE